MLRCAVLAGLIGVAACSVRAPEPIDVLALTRAEGTEGAHRALVARVLAEPRDVQARLALAALADRMGRPSEALAQLDEVIALGGPAGVRWHDDDRARAARLLLARGRVRLARGAASAEADLRRAATLGATVPADELLHARAAGALAKLRHADPPLRAEGRAALGELFASAISEPAWRGATADAQPEDYAALGDWLWTHGARRAAYDELAAWHEAMVASERDTPADKPRPTPAGRDPRAQSAYLRALAWWSPLWLGEVPPPPRSELLGPEACRFPAAACRARDVLGTPTAADAIAGSPIGERSADPGDALAWLDLGIRAQLRGEGKLGATIRARVDVPAVLRDLTLPSEARDLLARIAGEPPPAHTDAHGLPMTPLVAAAASGGLPPNEPAPLQAPPDADLRAAAVARYVAARLPAAPDARQLAAIAVAFRRDPSVAERMARDLVAASVDAAAGNAAVALLFEALGDPARTRAAWQAALDASGEPAYQLGLAQAAARANDPDAALIFGTAAAAASGDPAVAWTAVARALIGAGALQQGLTAARYAIDNGGPDALPAALELAIAASRQLGRAEQATELAGRRARLAPAVDTAPSADDVTDAPAAAAAVEHDASAVALARLWVATRWSPRDVASRVTLVRALPAGDPRLRTVQLELVALAGDADPARALEAVQALR